MTVVYKSTNGIPIERFLELHGDEIKDMNIIYAIQTNLNDDRAGRLRSGAPKIKIGKSVSGRSRIVQYLHQHSKQSASSPEGGSRVLYCETIQKRPVGTSGKHLVDVIELELKRHLRELGKGVKERGSEVFQINPTSLFEIIGNIKPSALRSANNPPIKYAAGQEKVCVAHLVGNKLNISPQYKEEIKEIVNGRRR